MTHFSNTELSAFASRAKGAMFLSIFGAAWLVLWNQRALHGNYLVLLLIAVIGQRIFSMALSRYHQFRIYAEDEANTPKQRRVTRLFHLVNVAQWITIFAGSNVLINLGLSDWVIPMAILVVGLHFLPLARLFQIKAHFYLGLTISVFAVTYPFILSGPTDPYGCFGVGVMLWSYALLRLVTSGQ